MAQQLIALAALSEYLSLVPSVLITNQEWNCKGVPSIELINQ